MHHPVTRAIVLLTLFAAALTAHLRLVGRSPIAWDDTFNDEKEVQLCLRDVETARTQPAWRDRRAVETDRYSPRAAPLRSRAVPSIPLWDAAIRYSANVRGMMVGRQRCSRIRPT